jgi:excisionase family DNA binding protein
MKIMKNDHKIQYVSTAELAKLLHVSRVAVFKKIQSGKIKAFKIGRNYVIPMEEVLSAIGTFISLDKKSEIDKVVKRAVKEYGETLRLLGRE